MTHVTAGALGSSKLIAFVGTADSGRARRFYHEVLGLSFVAEDAFALVFDAAGVMLRVFKVQALTPAPYTVLGWEVADIYGTAASLGSRGVTFERFPGLLQDEAGVWLSPAGGRIAWFKDPDGNVLSLTQFAEHAG